MRKIISILLCFFFVFAVEAKLPAAMEIILKNELGDFQERLDKVIVAGEKKWLLIKPDLVIDPAGQITLVEKTQTDDFLFSNNWIYTPIVDNSIKSFDYYPSQFQNIILQSKIHQEFIVPKDFTLPRDLAFLAGRIPIELSSVQLASDREELYKEKMRKLDITKPFEFLTYSFNSGSLSKLLIDKESKDKLQEKKDLRENFDIKYISSIKEIFGEYYFSDIITGEIYKYTKTKDDFDATKANQIIPEAQQRKIEKVFALKDISIEDGIKDFSFNQSSSYLYVVTKKSHQLLIIDFEEKLLVKSLALPTMIDGFRLISRSSIEPDKIVFYSKANDKIFFLNTYDLRISDEIVFSKVSSEFSFIPYSIFLSFDKIILGVEKISKTNKNIRSSGLMVFDSITNEYLEFVAIDLIPKEIIESKNHNSLFVLGDSLQGKAKLVKLDAKDFSLQKELALDADIAQASSITEIASYDLIAVPSSISNNLLLVDSEQLIELKKIEIEEPVNIIKAIN